MEKNIKQRTKTLKHSNPNNLGKDHRDIDFFFFKLDWIEFNQFPCIHQNNRKEDTRDTKYAWNE